MNSSQKAINSACRMLGIREHSEKQIRVKLINKGFDKNEITDAVEYLYREAWLSNERFCEVFIRSRVTKGQGKVRIEFELLQNEISQSLIDKAFDHENVNWQGECEKVLAKKTLTFFSDSVYGNEMFLDNQTKVATRTLEFKNKLKIDRFMKYRGFDSFQVKKAFSTLKIQISY